MNKNYDVIIVGSGSAGLYTALNLDPFLQVLLVTKRELTLNNSSLAQGGIASVYDSEADDIDIHIQDSLIAGGHENDLHSLEILVRSGPDEVKKLMEYGVNFDRLPGGQPHLTLEGGHSRRRILHHEDATGKEIVDKLIAAVQKRENITILENAMLSDLAQTSTGFSVNILLDGQVQSVFNGHYLVLATGGIGRVFQYTTNSAIATGDGIRFAHGAGAKIKNLHLIQFHPTAFNNRETRECFLITEAVRGEGAFLLNCDHERFMHRYDERLELAPRDVVSRSILKETKRTGSDEFYIDISRKDEAYLKKRFPMVYGNLLKEGYDLTKDHVPIYPCQHYLMGGIDVDVDGRTTVENLYAVGECAHTGVHGNNRLASNSLLEAIVFSHRAAVDISRRAVNNPREFEEAGFPASKATVPMPEGFRSEIRAIMQECCFIFPDKEAIARHYPRIREIRETLESGQYTVTADYIEAKSLAAVADIILLEVQ